MAKSDNLFDESVLAALSPRGVQKKNTADGQLYTAADIEVLEGLEPVRRRPGMYIGGTDEVALHHLFAEVIDNAMDEALAGYATWIEVELDAQGWLSVTDNGRGIPVDPHPKFKNKSALEVILTTLHAGGKFDSKVYETSGGLHGVGISVVNALSHRLEVEVARGQQLYKQHYERGKPTQALQHCGPLSNRRGTKIRFLPDPEIFGTLRFKPQLLFRMARSKAYLFAGAEIRWKCAPALLSPKENIPESTIFLFPGGLKDFLNAEIDSDKLVTNDLFYGRTDERGTHGAVEWAIGWYHDDGFCRSYCNTIPTGDGGTHTQGLRYALLRGLRDYGDLTGNKKASQITAEDVLGQAAVMLSVFVREPEFQGQTKNKLASQEALRIVETAVRDPFDHWLAQNPQQAGQLLEWVIERSDDRLRRRRDKAVARKAATRKLRLPGKLADCAQKDRDGTELFIVEGDSAGGSAKQARDRATQAILPLRGKILNVASAADDKRRQNQQLRDIMLALGCATGSKYNPDDLRYDKIILMTDADVDGAHIAALLITFFFRQLPRLIEDGHLYLAVPPLYRLSQGAKTKYARDDAHKDQLLTSDFLGRGKVEVSRFKGLGEMMPAQLKETTMNRRHRTLLQVTLGDAKQAAKTIEQLMGTKAESRFHFIKERAAFADEQDLDI